uniref:NACHT domain-containing protein n=1 Tax=Sinocyclocheilus grahami TaxID=75366 RepID=A0A672NQX2_SINGR
MRMERVDWPGDILTLVAQEASALVELLCEQNSGVLDRIFALVEPKTLDHRQSLTNTRDRVSAIVDYFKSSDRNSCRQFLTIVYQYSENIPLLLETTLVSIAGYTPGKPCSSSQNHKHLFYHLQSYMDALKSMVLQKYESVAQAVVKDIRLEDTWVYLRHRNPPRGKDRTIQPQASLDNHEGEESEHKVSVESLLKTTSRVVTLLGQAGSGKTLLVHCLGRDWAEGSFPSIHLLFLLEFRQLNLISRDLSLKELLFLFYPACDDDEEQSDAVFEFILSNPEKVCFIFDGYDEFRAKLTHPEKLESINDPNKPLPLTDLLSGLCSRRFLPDCTVLVTCRPRDVTDMFGSPGFITCELQGFDRLGVKEYAEQYFHKKGDELKKKAVNLLMNNRHLLSMSHVPGLCHICCVCMEHLFSSDGTDLQLPTSLTQIYMQIILAFLKRINGGVVSGTSPLQRYRSKIVEMSQLALKGLEESTIVFMDTDVSPELQEFGVKSGILSCVKLTREDGSSGYGFTFMHLTMQEFLAALHLMTSQNITESQLKKKLNLKTRWTTKIDPKSVFTDSLHVYVCGLAAEACKSSLVQLKGAEGTTAWVQKRQATVRNVLLGFAGSTSQTGPKIVELCRCAHETQDAKLARAIGSRPQFELRNIRLNAVDMDSLAFVTAAADQNVCLDIGGCSIDPDCLEILPSFKNVDHLIFRSRKYDDKFAEALCGILRKLQALQKLDIALQCVFLFSKECICFSENLHSVSENGVDMDGVVMLASAICNQKNLRKVDASENGKKKLVLWFDTSRRHNSRQLTTNVTGIHLHKKLSLTRSDIKPVYMTKLCKQLVKCENLLDIDLSHVDLSTNGALLLIRSLADCQRVTAVELRHQAEAFIKFVPEKAEAAICKLTEYKLCKSNVEKLSRILENCPRLSELDLSHNLLHDEGVKCFVDYLPKLKISSSVSLTGNQITQVGALHLVNSMNTCEKVVAVEVSLGVEDQSLIKFVQEHVNGKTLRLRECSFEVIHLKKLVEIVNRCPRLLTLELSSNSLHSQGLFSLLDSLVELSTIQTVKLRSNGLSSEQIEYFVKKLSSCHQHRDTRIEEPWLTGNAVASLIAKCLNLQPHIKEISVNRASINIITEGNSRPRSTFVGHSENFSPALQSISFDDCDIEGQHLAPLTLPIQKCHALQDLRFSQLKVDRKGADFFSAVIPFLRNLRNLTLDLKGAAEDEVATLMAALPKTTSFESLRCVVFLLTPLSKFKVILTQNIYVSFHSCSGWTAARGRDLVRGLVQCVSLAEIRLDSVILDEEGITILAQGFSRLTSLRRLSLNKIRVVTSETFVNGTGILCLLASFKGFRQMEEIELESWRIGDSGTYELVKYIPSWTELVKLSLSENQFGQQGSMSLCEGLMSMKALKILHLTSIGSSDLVGVASSLKHCPSIEDVSLSWNLCDDSLARTLAEILPLCTKLKRLDLEANNITTAGATVIAKCLPSCPSIEVIRLWRNPIAKEDENLKDQRLNFSSV